MQGKLIIIEGGDGSGKATQTKLLQEHLQKDGKPVQAVSFPDYDSDSSALVRISVPMPMRSIRTLRRLFMP